MWWTVVLCHRWRSEFDWKASADYYPTVSLQKWVHPLTTWDIQYNRATEFGNTAAGKNTSYSVYKYVIIFLYNSIVYNEFVCVLPGRGGQSVDEVVDKAEYCLVFAASLFHQVVQQSHSRLVGTRVRQFIEGTQLKTDRIASISALINV